ncbi:hypothetical protein CPB84DRAFT_1793259 [Gymnopilus junonius]|uniref:Uncharacterized protein n=1 Tax=Gymnopilus junonius TaxID=109634 RepID=A0A9P5NDA8_GYMJU|nr:hypothetical protein CPB84DRAFT_1793259 [Gymnopilus junonius]
MEIILRKEMKVECGMMSEAESEDLNETATNFDDSDADAVDGGLDYLDLDLDSIWAHHQPWMPHLLTFTGFPEDAPSCPFRPRGLKTLSIDGVNFQRAMEEGANSWLFALEDLRELTLAHYTTHGPPSEAEYYSEEEEDEEVVDIGKSHHRIGRHVCDQCRMSLYMVLEMIQSYAKLERVVLKSILLAIDPSEARHPSHMYDLSNVSVLVLEDIDPDVIQELFRVADLSLSLQSITLIRCPRLYRVNLVDSKDTGALRLVALEEDFEMTPFLVGWECEELLIDSCCSFHDGYYSLAFRNGTIGPNGLRHFPVCPFLTDLYLHFTNAQPPYTVRALKVLVEARGDGVDYEDENWVYADHTASPLERLVVTGITPQLLPGEEEWFQSRLMDFRWGGSR